MEDTFESLLISSLLGKASRMFDLTYILKCEARKLGIKRREPLILLIRCIVSSFSKLVSITKLLIFAQSLHSYVKHLFYKLLY